MARKPFNPDAALGGSLWEQPPDAPPPPSSGGGEPGSAPKPDPTLTPSLLNERIKRHLEDGFRGSIRVLGELTNLNRRGHWYFSIKDEGSVLPCVMWRSDAERVALDPPLDAGEEVLVTGRVSHWVPGGRTQFYVTKIERKGEGTLEQQFRALCAELKEAGYFDERHKQALPGFPRRIAVVTSASGAAIEDVRRTAANRMPSVELLVVDVRVQGDGAAAEIARAITGLDRNASRLGIDAILVTRGGGSREDLWAFNERVVADAAYRCRTPLVAAIGHEVDTSIIELVADQRASTPTQAAVHLVPDAEELLAQVDYQADRLASALRRRLELMRERFGRSPARLVRALAASFDRKRLRMANLATALEGKRPTAQVSAAGAKVTALQDRLALALDGRLQRAASDLDARSRQLRSVGPRAVLARGYACTLDADGRVVRSIRDVRSGQTLTTILSDGRFDATVQDRTEDPPVDQTPPSE
ncbi:MAG: exodeoxyribonuclease VII large subunit [Phycisphaerales bacterium]|nr:exodeoxyribonuclease VII large subunit [Phycisphaerales bacterium]